MAQSDSRRARVLRPALPAFAREHLGARIPQTPRTVRGDADMDFGVNINGAAAKVNHFDSSGKKEHSGTFGNIQVG